MTPQGGPLIVRQAGPQPLLRPRLEQDRLREVREYMPELPGLRREHIAVRRDRVTFKYSFP